MTRSNESLHSRYGSAQNPFAIHSVRAFLPDALPEHTLQTLVAAAQPADWSTQVLDRLRDAAVLKGRHRLYAALRGTGFCFEDVTGPR